MKSLSSLILLVILASAGVYGAELYCPGGGLTSYKSDIIMCLDDLTGQSDDQSTVGPGKSSVWTAWVCQCYCFYQFGNNSATKFAGLKEKLLECVNKGSSTPRKASVYDSTNYLMYECK